MTSAMKFALLVTLLPLVQALPLAKRDGTEMAIQNRLGNYYEIDGIVGDYFTNLSFVINSAQDDSWVSSDQFNTNLSNTFTSFTEEFCFQDFVTDMTVSGVYGSDTVSIESLSIDSLKFGVATTNQVGYSASLGLGSSSSFIEALYNAGHISSKIVSIWLQNNRSPGKIKFGGTDSSLYSGSLTYVDLVGYETDKTNGGYFISLDTIETSSGSKLASGQTGYIDTASVLSYVPSEVLEQITNDLQASVDQNSGLWTVDCGTIETTDLSYKLVFGSTEIEVQANQLFFQESNTCYLTVTETQIDSVAVLGQSFLTSIYLVFDLDKQQVGLAQVDVDQNVVTSCSVCTQTSSSSSSTTASSSSTSSFTSSTSSTSSKSSTSFSSSSTTSSSTSSTTSSSSSSSSSSSYSSSTISSSTSSSSSTLSSSTSITYTSSSVFPKTSSSTSSSFSVSTTSVSTTSVSTTSVSSTSTTPVSTSSDTSSSSIVSTSSTPSSSSSTLPCSGSMVTTTYPTTISGGDWTTVSVVTNYVCSFAVSSFETTTDTTCTICTSTTPSPEVATVFSHESSATPQSTVISSTSTDTSSTPTTAISTTPLQTTTISSSSSSSTPESHSSTLASTWITTSTPTTPATYGTTVHTENTVIETLSCSTESAPESSSVADTVAPTTSSETPPTSTPTSEVSSATPATQSTQTITEDCSCSTSAYVSSGTTMFTVVSTYTSTNHALVTPSTSSSLPSVTESQTPRLSSLADYSFVSSSSTTSAHSVLTFAGAGVRNQVSLAAILPVLFYIL
ncbi:hypothetical protein KL942_001801 [Ogataea angusta]|uniref:Peptidase A1 domain-containing protein n=1 Tax=Pichia angusta TaxID=870730 RepID=A0ABQ7RY78_PICAN|nr:hypothetical protein KL942_001801 [Ogataea angusta]KAG7850036.1 hypothetical protein KL940_002404 [Ogataea angusta]